MRREPADLRDAPSPPHTEALPAGAAGSWCRIAVRAEGAPWWAQVCLTDPARGQVVRDVFLGPMRRGWRATLVHVPASAEAFTVRLYGEGARLLEVRVRVLGRLRAAASLLLAGRQKLPAALSGQTSGTVGRVRAILGQAPARAGEAPPYRDWIRLMERQMAGPAGAFDVQMVVFGEPGPALVATLASIHTQNLPSAHPCIIARAAGNWRDLAVDWLVVLQAGEVLSPDALAWFAAQSRAAPQATFIYADLDTLDAGGARKDPLFKPGPDRLLLRTGLLTGGACAIRRDGPFGVAGDHADLVRLAAALARRDRLARVPRILTHRRGDTQSADPRTLAAITGRDLEARGLTGMAEASGDAVHVRFFPPPGREPPMISIIVPSACRSAHVLRCAQHLLATTSYTNFEVIAAVSAVRPGDAAQARVMRGLAALPGVRVVALGMPEFNYAAVNNQAARHAAGELLLLLNDDVAPAAPGWLAAMVAHMQDPEVGIVGARLLYGNGMVQHAGVIMGLAHLCEHAERLRSADDRTRPGLGHFTREVSAVTAACMLVRARLFLDLGGMDETFAVALNDVDFCLRARGAGHLVVYAADAVLYHYESLSLGRHYAGGRAALESFEVRRLRARWESVIRDDPFYNPQASLQPGREWAPGYSIEWQGKTGGMASPQTPASV